MQPPRQIDLEKTRGLTVTWAEGTSTFFPIAYLRKMSPSADMREMRHAMKTNPLAVLPSNAPTRDVTATGASLVGNYAIRITFSDGHDTGLYSWEYLREIIPTT